MDRGFIKKPEKGTIQISIIGNNFKEKYKIQIQMLTNDPQESVHTQTHTKLEVTFRKSGPVFLLHV